MNEGTDREIIGRRSRPAKAPLSRDLIVSTAHGGQSGQELERVKRARAPVSAGEFPLVFAFREALLSGSGDVRSDRALDVIIDGIVGARLPPGPHAPEESDSQSED